MDAAAPPVRWGIIGCARIAQKNVNSIRRARNATLVAVASRSKERCSKWCRTYLTDQEFDSVQAYGSYEELLADRNVDAVYLPLPTSLHKQWAAKVIAARKHLLIEKPAALSMEDLREITDGCRRNGLVFMDGVMFHHHRRMQRIVRHINDPVFGKVSRITSGFSFPSDDSFRKSDIRTSADGDPLGCVGDLGWYNIRFSLLVTGRTPDAVRCHFNNVVNGTVPFDTDTTLYWFKKGALTDNNSARNIIAGGGGDMVVEHVSTFHSSFNEPMRQWVEVTATPRIPGAAPKCLTLRDFVLPRNAERVNFKEQAAVGFADFVTLVCMMYARRVCMHGVVQ